MSVRNVVTYTEKKKKGESMFRMFGISGGIWLGKKVLESWKVPKAFYGLAGKDPGAFGSSAPVT